MLLEHLSLYEKTTSFSLLVVDSLLSVFLEIFHGIDSNVNRLTWRVLVTLVRGVDE